MKILTMIMPIAAVWMLSANEQGLVGNWAVWVSFGMILMIVMCQKIAERLRRCKRSYINENAPAVGVTEPRQTHIA